MEKHCNVVDPFLGKEGIRSIVAYLMEATRDGELLKHDQCVSWLGKSKILHDNAWPAVWSLYMKAAASGG
jgi:hypothetical protein